MSLGVQDLLVDHFYDGAVGQGIPDGATQREATAEEPRCRARSRSAGPSAAATSEPVAPAACTRTEGGPALDPRIGVGGVADSSTDSTRSIAAGTTRPSTSRPTSSDQPSMPQVIGVACRRYGEFPPSTPPWVGAACGSRSADATATQPRQCRLPDPFNCGITIVRVVSRGTIRTIGPATSSWKRSRTSRKWRSSGR